MNRVLAVNERDLDCVVRARHLAQASSTTTCATRACSSPSIPAPRRPRSAAWRRRARRAPRRCATAPCARTCSSDGGDGRRRDGQDRPPRAQVGRRLRPDPPAGRLRRHARHHHRAHGPPLRHPRGDPRRGLPVRDARGRLQRRHPGDPARARHRPHRAARRGAGPRHQHALQAEPRPRRRCCSWSSTAARPAPGIRSSSSRRSREAEGAMRFDWAEQEEDRRRLWKARHDAYWAMQDRVARQGHAGDRRVRADLAARRMRAGDPGRHQAHRASSRRSSATSATAISTPRRCSTAPIQAEVAKVKGFLERLTQRALAMDGTCTGEHGVGQGKIKYLAAEHGAGVAVMRADQAGARPRRHPQSRQDPGR